MIEALFTLALMSVEPSTSSVIDVLGTMSNVTKIQYIKANKNKIKIHLECNGEQYKRNN